MKIKHISIINLLLLMFFPGHIFAAGTKADYQRAETIHKLYQDKVYHSDIKVRWFDNNRQFWYKVQTGANRYEYLRVDAASGKKKAAFDHTRLAKELTKQSNQPVKASQLLLDKLKFSSDNISLTFQTEDNLWEYNTRNNKLIAKGPIPDSSHSLIMPDDIPGRSKGQGDEISVTFINRRKNAIKLYWLNHSGQRVAYGSISPKKEYKQHTYANHVWIITDHNDETIAGYIGRDHRNRVVIKEKIETPSHAAKKNKTKSKKKVKRKGGISPDKKYRAFIKENNLWLKPLEQNKAEVALTSNGSADHPYTQKIFWSPDSKRLIAIRRQKEEKHTVYFIESSPKDQLQPKLHSQQYLKPGDQVAIEHPHLFDPASKKEIPVSNALFKNPWSLSKYAWQADSSSFSFVYNQRGHQAMSVVAIDGGDGKTRVLVDEKSDTFICYSSKAYFKRIDRSNEIIWMSERDGYNHLYLYDAKKGRVKNQITNGKWVVRKVLEVNEKKREILFIASGLYPEQDPYYKHYCRVNFDGSGLMRLTKENGTHKIDFSPDKRYIIDSWSRVDQPPVTQLLDGRTGKLIARLENPVWDELLASGWQTPERFSAKGRDGKTDIYGVIWRPSTFNKNLSYPVIEYIYAGPHDSFTPKAFKAYHNIPMKMAELGFIVVQCDGMGTSNRSKAFHDVCWKNLADSGFPDRIPWIKAAAKKYPYMDTTRVGIFGGSAGGQSSTCALLTQGDFYKVAVSDCGCHDNRMDKIWWNEQWMGWPIGPHYVSNSNVTLAEGLKGKLLLIVGELDRNVDPASTMQVINALIKEDKDFDMLIVPGVGHGAAEGKYPSRRRADYFVRHLLGKEPRSEN